MTIREALSLIVDGGRLSETQAAAVADQIISGQAEPEQIAGLLIGLRTRGESIDEISGFVRAVRKRATPLDLDPAELVDTCGTGGDHAGTFNISTAAAFVAAAAGCRVAKHGNRSSASPCGSADVLEALGIAIDLPPARSAELIRDLGIGFLFAPQYHAGARHAAGPRRALGVRTIFNTVGPLVHPGNAQRQLLGVYAAGLTETMAEVLRRHGARHCLVVHGEDGLDEITLRGATRVTELRDNHMQTYQLCPEDFEITRRPNLAGLEGGKPAENARRIEQVLDDQPGPARDVVVLNAGAAIYAGGRAESIAAGVARARACLADGSAREKLRRLREASA